MATNGRKRAASKLTIGRSQKERDPGENLSQIQGFREIKARANAERRTKNKGGDGNAGGGRKGELADVRMRSWVGANSNVEPGIATFPVQ